MNQTGMLSNGLIAALLITVANSFAFELNFDSRGNEVGNGGDAIVCYDTTRRIINVEFLDLFENRILHDWSPAFEGKPIDQVNQALQALNTFSPEAVADIKKELEAWPSRVRFLNGQELVDIRDGGLLVKLPLLCEIEQIVIQVPPVMPWDPIYYVDADLWNHQTFSEYDKASLILHEVIYRILIRHGHKNSNSVRYLNTLLHANKMVQFTQENFEILVKGLNLTKWLEALKN